MTDVQDPVSEPDITVVMASFNRGQQVLDSVTSVLDQAHPAIKLIVVDASTDDTASVLGTVDDPRLVVEVRENLGMPVARNMGLEQARGRWIGFLDDDDVLHRDWAERMLAAATDDVDLVICGHRRCRPDGSVIIVEPPGPIGVDARVFVAGSFIVRAETLAAVGGMLEGLPSGHHWDLAVRLASRGAHTATVDDALLDIEVREPTSRDLATPLQVYDGLRWVVARHRTALAPRPDRRATFAANIAVPAARMGLWDEARRWLVRAVVAEPGDARHWARLGLACVPPLGRRVWGDARAYAPETHPSRRGLRAVADLAAIRGTSPPVLMLPLGYREAAPSPDDRPGRAERAAARLATACAVRESARIDGRIVDVEAPVPAVGEPVVLVAGALLSRAADPYAVLREVRDRLGPGDRLVVAEADRDRVDGPLHDGPPDGAGVRRRWTPAELRLLVEAAGLVVLEQHPSLPRWPWWRRRPSVTVLVARRP